ncbi:MAG: SDR family NAD(P)-dependent oxidoreductase, partial [Chloroflexota bacterium]
MGFAQAGADVVIAARSADAIKDTAAQVQKEGRKSLAVPTDVRNIDQIKNLLSKTLDSFLMAAQLLCTGEFTESTIPQGVYAELRTAHNAYRRLVKERTRITNLVKGLLDGLFSEFTLVFKDPCALTALSVLSICPIPRVIAGMAEDEFVATIEAQHKGRRLMRRKLRALHYSARTSIGIDAGARSVSYEISFLVEKLEL